MLPGRFWRTLKDHQSGLQSTKQQPVDNSVGEHWSIKKISLADGHNSIGDSYYDKAKTEWSQTSGLTTAGTNILVLLRPRVSALRSQ